MEVQLQEAAKSCNIEEIRRLFDAGVLDVNTADDEGSRPLHKASSEGHLEVAQLLIDKSANVNATDKAGWTPLHKASSKGHLEVAELLIEVGANVNATDENGETPLHKASRFCRLQVAKLLLEQGAKVNATDKAGWTPLHKASAYADQSAVWFLLEHGADMNIVNGSGYTALLLAQEKGRVEIVSLLANTPQSGIEAYFRHLTPIAEAVVAANPDDDNSPVENTRRDCLVVLQSSPLVWIDHNGNLHPLLSPDFEKEKKMLRETADETKALGHGEIDLIFEEATSDRLIALLATGRSPALHLSCLGRFEYLALEIKGAMQVLSVERLQQLFSATTTNARLKLVFLSAGHSLAAGNALVEAGVPHVICCDSDEVFADSAASGFAQTLYLALACGKRLKAAFELARRRLLVSASVEHGHAEMSKYVLLPQKPEGDKYHDVPIFFESPMRHMTEPSRSGISQSIIPRPSEFFLGREEDVYKMLQELEIARCVTMEGPSGIGKSSVAKAAVHYMLSRSSTFSYAKYFWVPSVGRPRDEVSKGLGQIFEMCKNDEILPDSFENGEEFQEASDNLVTSLYDEQALVIFDARELESDAGMAKLGVLLNYLLETRYMRVVIVCPAERHIPFNTDYLTRHVTLPPLDMRSSVLLFGNLCKFVQHEQQHYAGLSSPVDLANLLVPDTHAGCTHIKESMSERCSSIFSWIGEGNPKKIIDAATSITREEYNKLIQTGIIQLDNDIIPLLSKESDKERLLELQRLREALPSLAKLERQHAKLVAIRTGEVLPTDKIKGQEEKLGDPMDLEDKPTSFQLETSPASIDALDDSWVELKVHHGPPYPSKNMQVQVKLEDFDKDKVATNVSSCFQPMSIHAKYSNDPTFALLLTWELVELQVSLWLSPTDDSIVVEVQRLRGDFIVFDKYANCILDAAVGKLNAQDHQQVLVDDINIESLKSAEEVFQSIAPRTAQETNDGFAAALNDAQRLLKSDHMDGIIFGMDSLGVLADARQTGIATSILTSRAILLGVCQGENAEKPSASIYDVRKVVVSAIAQKGIIDIGGDLVMINAEHHQTLDIHGPEVFLLNRSLTILVHVMEVLVFMHEIYFVDSGLERESMAAVADSFLEYAQDVTGIDLLSNLGQTLCRAKQEPHNACLSVMCLRLFCTASEAALQGATKSKAIEAARNAREFGVLSHAKLEAETDRFLKAVTNEV